MSTQSVRYSHSHHLLSVKGCSAMLDVLALEGDEGLSTPFRYRIEFTSDDHGITREAMLMKPASLTLQKPGNRKVAAQRKHLQISGKRRKPPETSLPLPRLRRLPRKLLRLHQPQKAPHKLQSLFPRKKKGFPHP